NAAIVCWHRQARRHDALAKHRHRRSCAFCAPAWQDRRPRGPRGGFRLATLARRSDSVAAAASIQEGSARRELPAKNPYAWGSRGKRPRGTPTPWLGATLDHPEGMLETFLATYSFDALNSCLCGNM